MTQTNAYTTLTDRLGKLYSDACEQYRTSDSCRQLCDALEELLERAVKEPEYQAEEEGELLSDVPNVDNGCWLPEHDKVCGDGMAAYYVDGSDYTELLLCSFGAEDGVTMRFATALVVGRKVYRPDMGDTDAEADVRAMVAEYEASIE